jgi:hypothetical protein
LIVRRSGEEPKAKTQRVIEHALFEIQTPGGSSTFKLIDTVQPTMPYLWMTKEDRKSYLEENKVPPGADPDKTGYTSARYISF